MGKWFILVAAGLAAASWLFGAVPERFSVDERPDVRAAVAEAEALARRGSCREAMGMWEELAAAGSGKAAQWLGVVYLEGCGEVAVDPGASRRWYARGAELGDVESLHGLGMSLAGEGLYGAAAERFREAAVKGLVVSQYNLGILYDQGLGVPRDVERKAYWWHRAAYGGDARAQLDLGIMYANGIDMVKDVVRSYAWLRVSGSEESVRLLDVLEGSMTEDEVREGESLRRELLGKVVGR